ncbi:hypothetical protein FC83_GL000268 [Agrilactobacillus composti DSM 18527 = JCM 14202]|uniref:Mga helix-turn-helix domain-containing protein n=1 Tax=Agrilactobacillus composti DSM 18527 = JCM 14202 TaxID=1423734 RepID=X0PHZ7_9LACO|nr:helix-turn-helix domain-containing protein [Agrilactobacillus composti]KRM32703.1 hypothetical protein FC83_GL000268 [Agrilactobacillus composti DSM 18527 = JCM 14202]GAF41663.1 trans-acting positive regulator [Agrilactobacillus composti DSM 18527 = JCM 14202]
MDKQDLLDPKAAFDVHMLEWIFHKHGTIAKSELITNLDTTPRMLSDHVAALNDNLKIICADDNIELTENRTTVALKMKPELILEEITNRIIRNSLAYKILSYVFWHNNFTMQKMQQDLLISESTLFRAMNRINNLLSEFQISIRNNRINGSEINIRHFYYKLYLTLNARSLRLNTLAEPHAQQFLKDYEALVGSPLSEKNHTALRIYWNMVFQRLKTKDLKYEFDIVNIQTVKNKPFGRELIRIFEKNFNFFFQSQLKSEILAFIIFVSFENTVPMDSPFFKFLFSSEFPYIRNLRQVISEVLDVLNVKFHFGTHYHSLRYSLYLELGSIMYIPGVMGSRYQLIYTAMRGVYWRPNSGQILYRDYLIKRLQMMNPVFSQPTVVHFLEGYLTMILLMLLNNTEKTFQIGFYDIHEPSTNYYLIQAFNAQIAANFNVNVTPFIRDTHYDLVLTTNTAHSVMVNRAVASPDNVIKVKDFGTPNDFSSIFVVLDRLVSEYLKEGLDEFI